MLKRDRFLFPIILTLRPEDRSARLSLYVPGGISDELGSAMGGYRAWDLLSAHPDPYLHLPKHGLRQYLVRRPSDRRDLCLSRRFA
jgi:hypothetical protein